MSEWLLTAEVAELEGRTPSAVQKDAKGGRYLKIKRTKSRGRPYLIHKSCIAPPAEMPAPSSLTQEISPLQSGNFDGLFEDILLDSQIGWKVSILKDGENHPPGVPKTASRRAAALKAGIDYRTYLYWLNKYNKGGPQGLKHIKSNKGEPRTWDQEAIDFWIGLCLKKAHRKIDKASLYEILCVEAAKKGWRIGGYNSAMWWHRKLAIPQFKALQRGGARALDNLLPPVVRDYSDLAPFEILVGDQHRFDFWVMDEETGEVFRPEGYFWQDLRTRNFYGGAIAKKYDSQLMGLALRMGMKVFGPFGSIYTDHGKPEESRYIVSVLKEMRALGLSAAQTADIFAELDGADVEELHCMVHLPGSHTRAIVRNAKAKMIEGSFSALESIMRNQLKVPGHVKDLHALQEEQEIDQKEIERLASAGKLHTFREHVLSVFKGMDLYNALKPHRGVLREWAWKPRPKTATPMDCLRQCYLEDGWRPVKISSELTDLIFLAKVTRIVDRGRITLNGMSYEAATESGARELAALTGSRVNIRHSHPLDIDRILVFREGGQFITECSLTQYSSMVNRKIASRLIEKKRALRRQFLDEYRALTSHIPDFIKYSTVPEAEKAAAVVTRKRRQQVLAEAERLRPKTIEELNAEIEQRERWVEESRPIFATEIERYVWILGRQLEGKSVREDEFAFVAQLEAGMDKETFNYWTSYKAEIGLKTAKKELS